MNAELFSHVAIDGHVLMLILVLFLFLSVRFANRPTPAKALRIPWHLEVDNVWNHWKKVECCVMPRHSRRSLPFGNSMVMKETLW